jgi:hypothetical protein
MGLSLSARKTTKSFIHGRFKAKMAGNDGWTGTFHNLSIYCQNIAIIDQYAPFVRFSNVAMS